jgi:hypothetical protein
MTLCADPECACTACRAVNLANQAIVYLVELDRLADEVTNGESDNVALMASKDVAAVRDFICHQVMTQEMKNVSEN